MPARHEWKFSIIFLSQFPPFSWQWNIHLRGRQPSFHFWCGIPSFGDSAPCLAVFFVDMNNWWAIPSVTPREGKCHIHGTTKLHFAFSEIVFFRLLCWVFSCHETISYVYINSSALSWSNLWNTIASHHANKELENTWNEGKILIFIACWLIGNVSVITW